MLRGLSRLIHPRATPAQLEPAPTAPQPAIFGLPSELIDEIVALLDGHRRSLRYLCLTCRAFVPFGRRYLFRSLKLEAPARVFRLCQLLVRKPHLAMLVRKLSIGPRCRLRDGARGMILHDSSRRLLLQALGLMFGLQQLIFTTLDTDVKDILPIPPFLLQSLTIVTSGELVDIAFFERQHLVKNLTLQWIDAKAPLVVKAYCDTVRLRPLYILPRLNKLIADDVTIARAFLPSRPVLDLHIQSRPFTFNLAALKEGLQDFALSTGPLRSLTLELDSIDSDLIVAISTHLSGLNHLNLLMSNRAPPIAAVMSSFRVDRSIRAFNALHDLSVLGIVFNGFNDRSVNKESRPLMDQLIKACPSLHVVYLGDYTTMVRYNRTRSGKGSSSFTGSIWTPA